MSYQPKVHRKQGGNELVVASGGVVTVASGGEIDASSGGIALPSGTLGRGFIPLDLGSAREIVTNDIGDAASGAGDASGSLLATDTTPAYERINGATDKGLRVLWAAGNVDPIQFAPVPLPPDLDDAQDVSVHFYAEMGGATDAPVLTVAAFFNVGDTDAGGATGALADAVGEVSRTLAAADVPAHPGVLNLELTPGAHGTDTLALYAAWIEYVRKTS